MVLLTTLVPLILLIWSVRGITAAREGLIVLPIPIATSTIILHLIGFLKNYAPGNELASFASSLTPLVWVPLNMMIGFSLPEDIESDNDQKKFDPKFLWLARDGLFVSISILFWSYGALQLYENLSFLNIWSSDLLTAFLTVMGGVILISARTGFSWSFFGACTLKTGFIMSALTLTTYLNFLSILTRDLGGIGNMLALGWIMLFFTSLALAAAHFMSIMYRESGLTEGIQRNWHFLELFGFYVFLSMAPPTFFDLVGF